MSINNRSRDVRQVQTDQKQLRLQRLDNVFHRVMIALERLEIHLEKKRIGSFTLTTTAVGTDRDMHDDKKNPPVADDFHAELDLQCTGLFHMTDVNEVWVSEDINDSDLTLYDGLDVFFEAINIETVVEADSVTIQLDETQVELWSESEVKAAKTNVVLKYGAVCLNHPVWIKPLTKKEVLAKVTLIRPVNKNSEQIPYKLTPNTVIVFDGLPDLQQQIIEYSQIGGLDDVITKLRETIQIPLHYPHLMEKFNVRPPKGLLLHGPPGNGKTAIARAIANNMGANFISIDGPELLSELVGGGERKLREKFEEAAEYEHAIIFFDEIDSLTLNREKYDSEAHAKMVAQFLACMDGLKSGGNVFVIGATNRLHTVDPAFIPISNKMFTHP